VTIVGASHAIELGFQAATQLARRVSRPSHRPATVKPLDEAIILESLHKTGADRRSTPPG
jgi:pyruvate/2-oxoglutarate/acetoin dehydrogenase E1 component